VATDIVRLGATTLSKDTGAPVIQADTPIVGDEEGDALGQLDAIQSLGLSAVPAPATKEGYAEGAVERNVNGSPGVILGGRDTRTANFIGRLGPGATCLHSTGPKMDSRIVCGDQAVNIVVGAPVKMMATFDQKNKKIQITGFGHVWEMSVANGVCMKEKDGGTIQLKGGAVTLSGSSITLDAGFVFIGKGAIVSPLNAVAAGVAGPVNAVSTKAFVGL